VPTFYCFDCPRAKYCLVKTSPWFRLSYTYFEYEGGTGGESLIWLFLKINLSTTISTKRSRRGLSNDMVSPKVFFKNNQITLIRCLPHSFLKQAFSFTVYFSGSVHQACRSFGWPGLRQFVVCLRSVLKRQIESKKKNPLSKFSKYILFKKDCN